MAENGRYVVGISAFYHDAAAALLEGEEIIAAAQEERFTRKKHDASFPVNALQYCLREADITLESVSAIVFYEKPFLKFERLLETYLAEAPRGFVSFAMAMPVWLKEKLFLKWTIIHELHELSGLAKKEIEPKVHFTEHHQSHAASAFYPSPFEEAAILTVDGVGEWATTVIARGKGADIEHIKEISFPHSLGLLYSAFTYYTGFKVNSGEYKVMGLAPYGKPVYVKEIKEHLISIKDDGSFRLNMEYFNYTTGLTMTNEKFHRLFGGKPRKPETKLTQKEMDLARSVQEVTEEVMLKFAADAVAEAGSRNLVMAGGVALNCVANGRILREGIVDNLWIQPAAGDAGGALGAAFSWLHQEAGVPRTSGRDKMKGALLGPAAADEDVEAALVDAGAVYTKISGDQLLDRVAAALEEGKVVGWHRGRMEYGPRALGARSILGDARSPEMQSVMNLKIKFRESFRPFAPAVLAERVSEWFKLKEPSPYMLLVAEVTDEVRSRADDTSTREGFDKLRSLRSKIPAVTHVDYSARVQTVHRETNPDYHDLIRRFAARTGCPVIINTSFNVRGEPIVCSPADSYRCFMRTGMDMLVIENYLLLKEDQPERLKVEAEDYFELD